MDEDLLRWQLAASGIPVGLHDGLVLYLVHGLHPGHFLTAVLENNLLEAWLRADPANRAALARYIEFLYHHAPLEAWGSPEIVQEWMTAHRQLKAGAR